jgi:serine/threonine protein phosphatase PrpC
MPPLFLKDRSGTSHSLTDIDPFSTTLSMAISIIRNLDKSLAGLSTRSKILCDGEYLPDETIHGSKLLHEVFTLPKDWTRPITFQIDDYFLSAELRGRRPGYMEDRHAVFADVDGDDPYLFGVFDGHGGDECSEFLRRNILPSLSRHNLLQSDAKKALIETFESVDDQYRKLVNELNAMSESKGNTEKLEDGSTASVLVLNIKKDEVMEYHMACVGDSRAVMVKTDGSARVLVHDHHPAREDERTRIKHDGGKVDAGESGIYRVVGKNGAGLAVTRAFGDYAFKPFVTSHPEVVSGQVQPDDAYIFIASDGVWGDVSNDEVGRACALGKRLLPCCFSTPWLFSKSHRGIAAGGEFSDDDEGSIVIDNEHRRSSMGSAGTSSTSMMRRGRICDCICDACWAVSHGVSIDTSHHATATNNLNPLLSLRDRLDQIVELAFDRGSDDNITAMVIDLKQARTRLLAQRRHSNNNNSRPSSMQRQSSLGIAIAGLTSNGTTTNGNHTGNRRSVDAVLVAAARKISSATTLPAREVKDIELPVLHTRITNDLVLWRFPHLSFLWFFSLNVISFCVIHLEWPLLMLLAATMAFRLLLNFSVARLVNALQSLGLVSLSGDFGNFLERSYMVASNTIDQFCQALVGIIVQGFETWKEIVLNGSTTKVLITLRTLTYLYTPVPIAVLLWIVLNILFTVPALYARYQTEIDEIVVTLQLDAKRRWNELLQQTRLRLNPTLRSKFDGVFGT